MIRGNWPSILPPPLRATARETAEAIARALRDRPPVPPPPGMKDLDAYEAFRPTEEATLARGAAGSAIALDFIARASGTLDESAALLLEHSIDAVSEHRMSPSLASGFTGIAWAIEHIHGPFEPDDDPNEDIDSALLDHVSSGAVGEYDLISGLVGIGVYALERLPRALPVLTEVITRLDDRKEETPDGFTWFTPAEALLPETRERFPNGLYNLGMAHGVPGVIGMLARACSAGVVSERARALLDGSVAWLLAQRLPGGFGSCFGYNVAPGVEAQPARAAWCYGDPGVAAALMLAAQVDATWSAPATDIARAAALRAQEEAGVVDAGFCHGSAGLAHMFARFFSLTGGKEFHDAAVAWTERTLAMLTPGEGVAGIRTWGGEEWTNDPGLLTGAAGVALTLAALAGELAPDADRVWLIS